jgi:methyl-accepting chemotaxis protein
MSLPMQQAIALIHRESVEFEQRMQTIHERSAKITGRTNLIIRGVMALIAAAMIYVLYLTFLLTGDMMALAGDMVKMYKQFGEMTAHVNQINTAVGKMGGHVEGIPVIAQDMRTLSLSVDSMRSSVGQMDGAVGQMDANMVAVTNGVHDMAARFGTLTRNVEGMSWNVNQMRKPTDLLPPFMGR